MTTFLPRGRAFTGISIAVAAEADLQPLSNYAWHSHAQLNS
jgi:hypothetical protein